MTNELQWTEKDGDIFANGFGINYFIRIIQNHYALFLFFDKSQPFREIRYIKIASAKHEAQSHHDIVCKLVEEAYLEGIRDTKARFGMPLPELPK